MKKLIHLLCFIIMAVSARAQQTGLDVNFGAQGISLVTDTALSMQTNCIALQPDGKIVLAGTYYYYLPNFDLIYRQVIMRFNANGSRDSSFNQTGAIVKEVTRGTRMAAVLIQPDSRIVIAATTYAERYLPDGTPDSSFNDSSRFVLDFLGPYDGVYKAALQPDGKIVICGHIFQENAMVVRLKSDGTRDSSFGYNGLVNTTLDSSLNDTGFDITVQPDGKILLAGVSTTNQSGNYYSRFSVIRYLTDGSLDPAFNNGKGYNRISFPNQAGATAYYIGLQASGSIVVGGSVFYSAGGTFNRTNSGLIRLTPGGTVDSSFGINGRVTDDTVYNGISTYWFYPRMRMQPDGKILMALSEAGPGGDLRFALHRFNANGFIDVPFGTQGKVLTDITAADDMPNDVLVQPDGKLLVCGIANVTNSWPLSVFSYPVIVRYESNGHVGIRDIPAGIQNAVVYPNPVSSSFMLKYELAHDDMLDIRLTDILGKTVQHFARSAGRSKGVHTEYLSLMPVSAGNYFLVISGRTDTKTLKLVCE
ncbi:T9SS type A sorting domain-containing protein [Chitinophagaceae bacterium MMS25-I14]